MAKLIGDTLGASMVKAEEIKDHTLLEGYDLIGFGSGIYKGKHHARINQVIEESDLKGRTVFIFSTSGTGSVKYNKPLIKKLTEKGVAAVSDFSCKGYDTFGFFKWIGGIAKGHPNNQDLENARDFAKSFLQ